jgi:GWxTD domain-containing protein
MNKKKVKIKTFVLLLILSSFVFSQEGPTGPFPGKEFILLYSEINTFPASSKDVICFYSFRIPYDHLVFVKNDSGYMAKFSLGVEVYDSLGNFADRQIKQDDISVKSYDETNSDNEYYQGILTFKLTRKSYNFLPVFTDINSKEERKLNKIYLALNSDKYDKLFPPVFVNSLKEKCGDRESEVLTNFNGFLPFSSSKYDIIIPSVDTTLTNLKVIIASDKDTIYNSNLKESSVFSINLQSCNNQIYFDRYNTLSLPTRNFIIKGISTRIPEGNLSFFYSFNDGEKPAVVQYKKCVWFNKPHSLYNPEFAIKILSYFSGKEEVEKLLDAKEKDYPQVLNDFWKKYDPTPSTRFNELMSEYYKRVDYTEMNFSSLSGKKGYDLDRGKVYIQFGKPQKIERSSDSEGKVVETWYYDKEKKFIFVDKLGTGDFPLQNK